MEVEGPPGPVTTPTQEERNGVMHESQRNAWETVFAVLHHVAEGQTGVKAQRDKELGKAYAEFARELAERREEMRWHSEPPERARLAADVVVLSRRGGVEHVLLIERAGEPYRGYWALPGGFLNQGERPEAAAIRELREETELVVDGVTYVGVSGNPERDPRGRVVSFACKARVPGDAEAVARDDAKNVRWVPITELHAVELAFDHANILTRALGVRELADLAGAVTDEEVLSTALRVQASLDVLEWNLHRYIRDVGAAGRRWRKVGDTFGAVRVRVAQACGEISVVAGLLARRVGRVEVDSSSLIRDDAEVTFEPEQLRGCLHATRAAIDRLLCPLELLVEETQKPRYEALGLASRVTAARSALHKADDLIAVSIIGA